MDPYSGAPPGKPPMSELDQLYAIKSGKGRKALQNDSGGGPLAIGGQKIIGGAGGVRSNSRGSRG